VKCYRLVAVAITLLLSLPTQGRAQDASTGALRGTVRDEAGARVAGARITLLEPSTQLPHDNLTGSDGSFAFDLLAPGNYELQVSGNGFAPYRRENVRVEVGTVTQLTVPLAIRREKIIVSSETPLVDTQSSAVANVIEQSAISDLPLNGRRFTDLALLTPGVTQDPRGLTSSANGDLAFGGIRGFHSSFFVDGADNNNAFFGQARGRYRAPYQFSNEVVQEFRVSSNTYGAELGGAGGAVINVVTRSGTNHFHGSAFYFLRDSEFNARHPFLNFKPADRQHQMGFTLGGPVVKNRVFFFAGFDQHIFHVPAIVEFLNGTSQLTPAPTDYEITDQPLVFATAGQLTGLAGENRAALLGNAGFAKVEMALTPRHFLSARLSTSRYYGANNVFFDPASPVTNFTSSNNGEENVTTESASVSLTSGLSPRIGNHIVAQLSRDLQQSSANSQAALTRIVGILSGLGRSDILPRATNEHRLHVAETFSITGRRHSWKLGADLGLVWIRNFFPSDFGGSYTFYNIRVDPFTFQPQTFGLELTPLRAYAHDVPRFYDQTFGSAVSHPNTHEYSLFAQDAIRVTDHLALNLGARYDLQTFRSHGLVSDPLYPDSGKVPFNGHNIAPRAGFAYSLGEQHPLVIRGGYGLFYTLIPEIYTSQVEIENGINRSTISLDNSNFFDRQLFPVYPLPLASCAADAASCAAPASALGKLRSSISAFAHNFQTPYVQQASAAVENEVMEGVALGASYLYVHGEHLIRARDTNLPKPTILSYPVYDDSGTNFLGTFYNVASFSTSQFVPSVTCHFPPCINPLDRPIATLGSINVFESAASSVYNGFTFFARRRMAHGVYFRVSYTFAKAIDDGQDALVAGAPALVQNSYSTAAERGLSVTDQRHRLVVSWIAEPHAFHREHPMLRTIFNDWKLAGITTYGSGRPINARVLGDANADGNSENDRLPGIARNSFVGPDYATTDLRLSRYIHLGDRMKVEFLVESFNAFNHENKIVQITDNGFTNVAAQFVGFSTVIGAVHFPASFRNQSSFLKPTNAYAPRQVQVGTKITF
jgi:hypothetical protein